MTRLFRWCKHHERVTEYYRDWSEIWGWLETNLCDAGDFALELETIRDQIPCIFSTAQPLFRTVRRSR